MPHLNQLIEQYKKQGFEVLCVTDEYASGRKEKTEEFIESTGLKAPVAYLAKNVYQKLMKGLGGRGIPFSALVDPKGVIVWKGHPGNLKADLIEKHIGGARIGGNAGAGISFDAELPKAFSGIAKGLAKGKVGSNLAKIEKALQNARTSADDKVTLAAIRDEVRGFFDTEMKGSNKAKDESRFFDAVTSLSLLAKHYKGHELGKAAQSEKKAIMTNKELKDEIEAGKRIAKAMKAAAAGKATNAKKSLEIILSGYLKNTKEAQRAKQLLTEI